MSPKKDKKLHELLDTMIEKIRKMTKENQEFSDAMSQKIDEIEKLIATLNERKEP